MALKFSPRGLATAYLILPPASFRDEATLFQTEVEKWHKRFSATQSPPEAEILYLLGQANMAVQLGVVDFRTIVDLRYPSPTSSALTFNWLYSVRYEVDAFAPPVLSKAGFRLLLHLRLDRAMYAYSGVEELSIEALREIFERNGIAADVHAGLGWNDQLINASFPPEALENVMTALVAVHSMMIDAGGTELPIFT